MTIELKTNTAVRIPVGPLVDPTDGKTAETALTVTDLSVQIYQVKNEEMYVKLHHPIAVGFPAEYIVK